MVNYAVIAEPFKIASQKLAHDKNRLLTVWGLAIEYASARQERDAKFDPFHFFRQCGMDHETTYWALKFL